MEKEQFVAVEPEPWWLLQRDVDDRIEDLRRKLGSSFGWVDPAWYQERDKLVELYEFILTHPRAVLDELDLAIDNELRLRWLNSLVKLKAPAEPVPAWTSASPKAAAKPGAATSDAPTRRPAFGSRAQAAPTTDAPPRRAAFGSRAQAASGDAGNGAQAAPLGEAPPRRSPFGPQAEAAAGAAPDGGPGRPGAEPTEAMVEQILKEVSALSTDELSAMAREVELSPAEVEEMMADPDFARLVAEERARLDRVGA